MGGIAHGGEKLFSSQPRMTMPMLRGPGLKARSESPSEDTISVAARATQAYIAAMYWLESARLGLRM